MLDCRRLVVIVGAATILSILSTVADAQYVERGILFKVGEKLRTELTPSGDVDLYVFYGVKGARVSLTLSTRSGDLAPTMALMGPDHAVLDVGEYTKHTSSKIKLRKYPLPATGPFFVRISDPLGRTGEYELKTKGDLRDVPRYGKVTLAPGDTYDIVFGASPGLEVSVVLKPDSRRKTVRVLSVFDPDGEEVPHGTGSFINTSHGVRATMLTRSSARSSWRDDADSRRIGEYCVRIGGTTTTTTVKIKLKVRHVRVKGTREIASTIPVITHLEPEFGRPGTNLIVHGENFLPGQLQVLFGEAYGRNVEYLTPETLAVKAPFGEGEVDITVINSDGQEGMLEDGFIFIPYPPAILNMTPEEGPDDGGTVINVYGDRMSYVEKVEVGDQELEASPEIVEDWNIRFTTEAMEPGTYSVTLVDRFGQEVTFDDAFTFVAAPVLLAMSPAKGGGGRPVTCIGQNFRPDHVILVDGSPVETTYLGPTALRFVTPPGDPGDKILVAVRDIWARITTLPDPYEYAYSYGVFDEPFSTNNLEDKDFAPTTGGIASWNPATSPGKLVATYGSDETNVPNPISSSYSSNVIPLGTGSFLNMYNITWYNSKDLGSAGTISGFKFISGSSTAPNAVMSSFTVKIGHNTSSSGLTTSSPRTANFSGTPVTVLNGVTYTLPSSISSGKPVAYPTFSKSFAYNGKDHLAVDTSKTSTTQAQAWAVYSGYGKEVHRVYGYPSTSTTASGSSSSYYYQCVVSFRSDTSMAQSLFFRTESDATEYLDPIVDPSISSQPTGTEVLIEYQGAKEHALTGDPDPVTYTDWTEDPTELRDHRYLRFRVSFKANLETEQGPTLDRIQVPYLYFD